MRYALLLLLLASCTKDAVHVFTAASMEEPIAELAGKTAVINAAASSALARQIEAGARADLFVSADREWAQYVSQRTTTVSRAVVAKNRLVLVSTSTKSADQLLAGRLALADPSHVPAGKYAKTALEKMGRFREESIAAAGDVRAALAMVERGEAEAGIVYAADAALSPQVRVVAQIESPTPIEYEAVLLSEAARPLFERLSGEEGRRVLAKHGFFQP